VLTEVLPDIALILPLKILGAHWIFFAAMATTLTQQRLFAASQRTGNRRCPIIPSRLV